MTSYDRLARRRRLVGQRPHDRFLARNPGPADSAEVSWLATKCYGTERPARLTFPRRRCLTWDSTHRIVSIAAISEMPQLSRLRTKGWRVISPLVLASGALLFCGSALSGSFAYDGFVGVGEGNGQCYWYSGQSACSGWAYWNQLNATDKGGDEVHAGFQNSSRIRGGYLFAGQADIFYPGDMEWVGI